MAPSWKTQARKSAKQEDTKHKTDNKIPDTKAHLHKLRIETSSEVDIESWPFNICFHANILISQFLITRALSAIGCIIFCIFQRIFSLLLFSIFISILHIHRCLVYFMGNRHRKFVKPHTILMYSESAEYGT